MSDMRIVPPNPIDAGAVTTNVDWGVTAWTAGTYALGDRARVADVVYESLQDSNTDEPTAGAASNPPTWVRVGYDNRVRMFKDAKDSQTTNLDEINVTFSGGAVYDTVAVLGMSGLTLTVEVIDGATTQFTTTLDLRDPGVDDFWEYYFLPFDTIEDVVVTVPYFAGANIRVLVEADVGVDAKVGLVLVGLSSTIGVANYGTQVGLINFTTFERDGFGNLNIVPRRTVNTAIFDVTVETAQADAVVRTLRRAGGSPSLFIGDEDREATIIYGVPEEPRLNYTSPSISSLSLEVQGK